MSLVLRTIFKKNKYTFQLIYNIRSLLKILLNVKKEVKALNIERRQQFGVYKIKGKNDKKET